MAKNIIDVQPIRNLDDIEKMKRWLKKNNERDYIMFLVGINTGLRMGDILSLKTADILSLKNKKNKHLKIVESKTRNNKNKKPRTISFNSIYDEVYDYAYTVDSEWLFPSRQGDNAITVTQAYRVLNKGAYWCDIESVGTHTLRKTYAYHMYKSTLNVALVQGILNHSKPEVTLRYIGINDEEINNAMDNFSL